MVRNHLLPDKSRNDSIVLDGSSLLGRCEVVIRRMRVDASQDGEGGNVVGHLLLDSGPKAHDKRGHNQNAVALVGRQGVPKGSVKKRRRERCRQ